LNQELFVEVNNILNFLSLNDLKEFLLNVFERVDIFAPLAVLLKGIVGARLRPVEVVEGVKIVHHVAVLEVVLCLIGFLVRQVVFLILFAFRWPRYLIFGVVPSLRTLPFKVLFLINFDPFWG
jgi:hypothetical protein